MMQGAGTECSSTVSIFTSPRQALSAAQDVPVTKLVFLEGLASQREDIEKRPQRRASVTQVQHDVLQLLREKE